MRKRISAKHIRKKRCEITDRDYQVLRFLWKWKLVSSTAIAKKFFPTISPHSAFRRLQYLEADGYIKTYIMQGRGQEVWQLADRGFKFILPKLGELKQVGYKSETAHHDLLASAFHLGEWLTHQPDNSQDFSEQQLRRFPSDAWPPWIPRSPTHRPDGYSIFSQNGSKVVVAFETELSVKERRRYEALIAYYDSEEIVQYVFWLVDSKVVMNAVKKSFEKFQMRCPQKHQFILLKDFQSQGWGAPIVDGILRGRSLLQIIPTRAIAEASPTHPHQNTLVLLDFRRKPIIPKTCISPKKS